MFNIEDSEVLMRAMNRAHTEGAIRGTMFTGEVANSQIERMHTMRALTGTTWLGGKVTQLEDGDFGPTFRIDWEVMPFITEVGE